MKVKTLIADNQVGVVTDEQQIANKFNNFFQNIPLKLLEENNLSVSNSDQEHSTTILLTDQTCSSLNLDSMDAEKIIPNLKNKASAAIEKISSKIFKLMPKF